ncbi:MAG: hypothetical protein Pyrs2KO_34740 [Pyruvatibacter sp.]
MDTSECDWVLSPWQLLLFFSFFFPFFSFFLHSLCFRFLSEDWSVLDDNDFNHDDAIAEEWIPGILE